MKKSVVLLLLAGCAVAQSASPFRMNELADGSWQGVNVTSQEILAYVVNFTNPHYTILEHDYYFKPNGVLPGALEHMHNFDPNHQAQVLWVQFVDGTEWGDHTVGQNLLNQRGPLLQEMNAMIDAYSKGGDKGLSSYIASAGNADGFALSMAEQQKRAGVDGVLARLKVNLSSAAQHANALSTH
jgi:hypothetical protein